MKGNYERELKAILQGEEATLKKITRSCDAGVRSAFDKIRKKPFFVVRSAGSLGIDLIAIRDDFSFPIEVKASLSKRIHFSSYPRLIEQADTLKAICVKAGVMPLYAFRLKKTRGDAWRMFTLEMDAQQRLLYSRMPKLSKTADGYYVIAWDDGMPLHELIDYLCP